MKSNIFALVTLISYLFIVTGDYGDVGFRFPMCLFLFLGIANKLNIFIILPFVGFLLIIISFLSKRKALFYVVSLLFLYPNIVSLLMEYYYTSLKVPSVYYYSLLPFTGFSLIGLAYSIRTFAIKNRV